MIERKALPSTEFTSRSTEEFLVEASASTDLHEKIRKLKEEENRLAAMKQLVDLTFSAHTRIFLLLEEYPEIEGGPASKGGDILRVTIKPLLIKALQELGKADDIFQSHPELREGMFTGPLDRARRIIDRLMEIHGIPQAEEKK